MDSRIIFNLAYRDNYTIKEVLTILGISRIIDKEYNLTPSYVDTDLSMVWDNIRDKKLLLELSKIKTRKRRR
ncbi:hypothetical protein SAMN05660477_01970 [Soonwooa buanensis]|uniref:Uncharacterized protein n=1 Tax=Soonwooa buanensis TaxID=619805 RepID=A0A1T5FDX2_9FLAO|nr:hypothetical protein SAMN05660477_01970 [Soonwooa buanensis]